MIAMQSIQSAGTDATVRRSEGSFHRRIHAVGIPLSRGVEILKNTVVDARATWLAQKARCASDSSRSGRGLQRDRAVEAAS